MAWGVLSDKACRENLLCSTAELHYACRSAQEGHLHNALDSSMVNVSNAVTAMFTATGGFDWYKLV